MKIANFRDYVNVLREVYSRENMDELGNYYRTLMASGNALKKQKALLQKLLFCALDDARIDAPVRNRHICLL